MAARSVLLVVALLGCGGAAVAPAPRPVASAPARVEPPAEAFPPPDACRAASPEEPTASLDEPDDAPLAVRATPQGLALTTRGARAGRVLVELGRAAGKSVRVEGFGAAVRIWARVEGKPFEAVAGMVVRAASLVAFDAGGGVLTWLDPGRAAALRRDKILSELELAPIETRLVASRTPRESARVLAATVLSCRGGAVASPRIGAILLQDVAGNLNRAEALVRELERGSAVDVELGERPPAPSREPMCDAIAPKAAPNLASGATSATGTAAGDTLLRLATDARTDVVIGCGGDRPAFYHPAAGVDLLAATGALGLVWMSGGIVTSPGVARQLRWFEVQRQRPLDAIHLRTFATPHVEDLEVAARSMGSRVAIVPYAPKQLLVAVGTPPELSMIEELVKAWAAPPRE